MKRVLPVVALLLVVGCRKETPATEGTVSGAVMGVGVQAVRVDAFRESITAIGKVVPDSAVDWTIYALESARIAELPKKEGEAVAAGDLLVRLDIASVTQDLALRQLELNDATAKVAAAQSEHARIADMVEKGVLPRVKLDEAVHEVSVATTALTQARTLLGIATTAADRTRIKAKFGGIVLKIWHLEGEQIMAGATDPILRVADPTRLQVVVPVPVDRVMQIVPGQPALVSTGDRGAAAGAPGLPAVVATRPVLTDAKATTGEARVSLSAGVAIPVDTLANVEIVLAERQNVMVIPTAALIRADGPAFVMIAGSDGFAHKREVRLGQTSGPVTEVLSGVAIGELVIVKNLDRVTDGMAIAIER